MHPFLEMHPLGGPLGDYGTPVYRSPVASKGAFFTIALGPRPAPGGPQLGWLVLFGAPNNPKARISLQEASYVSQEINIGDST